MYMHIYSCLYIYIYTYTKIHACIYMYMAIFMKCPCSGCCLQLETGVNLQQYTAFWWQNHIFVGLFPDTDHVAYVPKPSSPILLGSPPVLLKRPGLFKIIHGMCISWCYCKVFYTHPRELSMCCRNVTRGSNMPYPNVNMPPSTFTQGCNMHGLNVRQYLVLHAFQGI